jgi:Flp pilus assembly protein TadG
MVSANEAAKKRNSSFHHSREGARGARGVSLVIVSLSLFLLLGVAGLAIDLGSLYVARTEAQRAADAAALAGAQQFVVSGFTSGLVPQAVAETLAAQQAASVGNNNPVGGLNPRISPGGFSSSCPPAPGSDGCFNFSNPGNPRITVVVQRTAARGDAVPIFFMRIFGVQGVDVAAQATAEAYNPSAPGSTGGGPTISTSCLKPWLVPNCDPNHTVRVGDPRGNPNCPVSGGLAAYFVDPNTGAIEYPGPTSSGGAIGESFTIKQGDPLKATAPSKFYPIYLPQNSTSAPAACPTCANNNPRGGGSSSGALYRSNIECCNVSPVVCSSGQVQPITGDMVGPTSQGVDCLIHEQNGTGMDILDVSTSPFQIKAGSNNPLVTSGAVPVNGSVTNSDSVITVPLFDGTQLCPGNSCPSTVQVNTTGFLQLFIKDVTNPQGTVEAYVLNVTSCPPSGGTNGGGIAAASAGGGGTGSLSGGTGGTVGAGPGSPIPVRLIHN